jgi:hypothetical protein
VAALHNKLGLTRPLDPRSRPYFDRPYQVIGAGRFAEAQRAAIADPQIRALPLAGAVDQVIDSTDAIGSAEIRHAGVAAVTGRPGRSGPQARGRPYGEAGSRLGLLRSAKKLRHIRWQSESAWIHS